MTKTRTITTGLRGVAFWFERILAVGLFLGVMVFSYRSVAYMATLDWSKSETVYELIYRVLLVVIGLELIRTLITHELEAVLELLAFVVARKTLKPDLTVVDIFLSVMAFCLLLLARRYLLIHQDPDEEDSIDSDLAKIHDEQCEIPRE